MAQSMIVLCLPHRSMPILSNPGTGGTRRRAATSTMINAIVKTSAIRRQDYHWAILVSTPPARRRATWNCPRASSIRPARTERRGSHISGTRGRVQGIRSQIN